MSDSVSGPSARIERIPTLPIFVKLDGRCVLLGGGDEPAVWKAELLAATGARVIVCDPVPCPAMLALAEAAPGSIELNHRAWDDSDFAGVALAIGAFKGEEALAFQGAARRAGVTVNIVDNPDLCDFQFGTIVARPPLLIAISTDGAAPVLGQALRARIEALLPATIGAWAKAAKDWRPDVQARNLGFAARRRFWEGFADRALNGSGRAPQESDRLACLESALATQSAQAGRFDLVGLGPGDPDLVTLRAVRALQSADMVIYERGVDPAILALGRRESDRVAEPDSPDHLAELIAAALRSNKRIAFAAIGHPDGYCWQARRQAFSVHHLQGNVIEGLACSGCSLSCRTPASAPNDPA